MKNFIRVALLLVLIGAFQLSQWAKNNDPRFHKFLNSSIGSLVARTFGWQKKNNIKVIYPSTSVAKHLFWDIYSQSEDQDFQTITGILDQVWNELVQTFPNNRGNTPLQPEKITLVLFLDQSRFQSFLEKNAMDTHAALGFFDSKSQALFIVDPREVKKNNASNLDDKAYFESVTSLKHEVAHAYFHFYGFHSPSGAEGTWLIEGLAAYAEGLTVGSFHPSKMSLLKNNTSKLWSLEQLISHRDPMGFMSLNDQNQVELIYSESWALVYFLMKKYPQEILSLLNMLRNPELTGLFAKKPFSTIFQEILKKPIAEIQNDFFMFINESGSKI